MNKLIKNLKGVKTEISKILGRVVAQPLFYKINPLWQKIKNPL